MNDRELFEEIRIALDDWINTYAPEFCCEVRVQEARERIANAGGTLGYVSTLSQRVRERINELDSKPGTA